MSNKYTNIWINPEEIQVTSVTAEYGYKKEFASGTFHTYTGFRGRFRNAHTLISPNGAYELSFIFVEEGASGGWAEECHNITLKGAGEDPLWFEEVVLCCDNGARIRFPKLMPLLFHKIEPIYRAARQARPECRASFESEVPGEYLEMHSDDLWFGQDLRSKDEPRALVQALVRVRGDRGV